MVNIRFHQPVEGRAAEETADIPAARASWYVAEGYASLVTPDGADHQLDTSVAATLDPTLNTNREAPDNADGDPLVPTTANPTVIFRDAQGAVQESSGTAGPRSIDPKTATVAQVDAYLTEHPDRVGEVRTVEKSPDGAKRAGVLRGSVGRGPTDVKLDDRSAPKPVDPAVVGPATPSADTLAGREVEHPNTPAPGPAATTVTPGDPKNDEPEPGTVIRNPATGTEF